MSRARAIGDELVEAEKQMLATNRANRCGPPFITISEVSYHRNGVGGEGFHVVAFSEERYEGPEGETEIYNLVAIVFPEQHELNPLTAVLDRDLLGQGVIAFGVNSWRGDRYDKQLREAIDAHEQAYDPHPPMLTDEEALDRLNLLLSASEWPGPSGMEDVDAIVRQTGRAKVPHAPEWSRH